MIISASDKGKFVYLPEWRGVQPWHRVMINGEYWIIRILGVDAGMFVHCDHIALTYSRDVVHTVKNDRLGPQFFERASFISLPDAIKKGVPVSWFTPIEIAQSKIDQT